MKKLNRTQPKRTKKKSDAKRNRRFWISIYDKDHTINKKLPVITQMQRAKSWRVL